MKKNLTNLMILVISLMLFNGTEANCETQLTISPPPITTSSFEKGKNNQRWDISYLSMSMDEFSAIGLGFDYKARTVMSKRTAITFQLGIFALSGESDGESQSDMEMSVTTIPVSLNFEYQPIRTKYFNIILFAGGLASKGDTNVKFGGEKQSGNTVMTGFQGGIQTGFEGEKFGITPFFLSVTQSGESEYEETTVEIEEYRVNTIGFDIIHKPSGYTLSSVLDFAETLSGDDEEEEETKIVTIKFGRSF